MQTREKLKANYKLIVIGGGPAGLAAALEAKKNGLDDILIIERQPQLGGILPQCIHNGFGSILFGQDMPGPMYASKFIESVLESDINVLTDTTVVGLTSDKKVYITSSRTGYVELSASAVVLAMGCRERTRAQIKLAGSRPAGIFTAGTVQRLVNIEGFMPGERFVILGSGDIGMIMARRLTLEGAHVEAVLEILPYLTGLRRNYVQCLVDFGIPLHLSTTVNRIIGRKRLQAIETIQVDENLQPIPGTERIIECDTLVLSVGLIPENELSQQAGIKLDSLTGGPIVDDNMATNVPGIFAAGNVVTIYDLVDYVSQAGYTAGRSAAMYVKNLSTSQSKIIEVKPGHCVRSIVPQKIVLDGDDNPIPLCFRVTRPFDKRVKIELTTSDDKKIKSASERYARPAEMLTFKIKPSELNTDTHTGTLFLGVSES